MPKEWLRGLLGYGFMASNGCLSVPPSAGKARCCGSAVWLKGLQVGSTYYRRPGVLADGLGSMGVGVRACICSSHC